MRYAIFHSVATAILIGLIGVTPASADPVTITSGQAVATLAGGSFVFQGEGLSAGAGLPDGWASTVALFCSPCSADHPITLSFSSSCVSCLTSGSSGNVLGGVTYPSPTTFRANFDFHGPSFSSSEVSSDHLTFTAPFTMIGHLDASTGPFDPDPPFYSTDLIGSGTATITFTSPVGGLFDARNITYDFSAGASPTPEPASLLLLGSGTALLWRKRRR